MMKKLIMDDFSLLGNALALAAKKAPTLESLAAELNVRQEDLSLCWFALKQPAPMPRPRAARPLRGGCGGAGRRSIRFGQLVRPTWRLNKLLEEFQVNEGFGPCITGAF